MPDFHLSAQDIRVEGNTLKARLDNGEGGQTDAELDLNSILGNNDGTFVWADEGFARTAEEIHFTIEGGDNVPILRAQLRNNGGELQQADINLAERIGNDHGKFVFE
ncbi:CVNH domain-containing protein [Podospora appendiculata]|uniref:CVNH domain-containing protein n=1 Tax=Podospora appendiculata TaxID=314037 RepID=A0AAE1C8S0_9PEZI|nr:CVNH domain-containing protein [Podospora appendiculata]